VDITTLAAWGEFIGGIAVVVSLIYLASQIRQNSQLLKTSITSAVADSDRTLATEMLRDPSLRQLWIMDSAEFESLPESGQEKIKAFLVLQLTVLYRDYYFAKDGAIRHSVWEAELRSNLSLFAHTWVQQFWSQAQYGFSDEFGEFINGRIEERGITE